MNTRRSPRRRDGEEATGLPTIKVVVVGIGETGRKVCHTLLGKAGIEIVAACDKDPAVAGRDLGQVIGLSEKLGLVIDRSIEEMFSEVGADVAVYCTVTALDELCTQVLPALEAGCNVIATSEVLSYPWRKSPDHARKLDAAAKRHGVSVLGTGICPGFMPDLIPMVVSAGCREIRHIDVQIFGDVYPYGPTVWKGMGLGLTPEEYQRELGGEVDIEFSEPPEHVMAALGLRLDEVREDSQPLIAPHDIRVGDLEVKKGTVCGFSQTTTGFIENEEVIRQHVYGPLCCNLPPFWVEVTITGEPNVKMRLDLVGEDGWSTSTLAVNTIPRVIKARPGLISMKDLEVPSAILGDMRGFLA